MTIFKKISNTIKYPLSISDNGFFLYCETHDLIVKNLLQVLLYTKLGLLAYDVLFGLNLQQFLFLNYSFENLLLKCKNHIINKARRYVKDAIDIDLLINTDMSKIDQHVIFFMLTYKTISNDSQYIKFVLSDDSVIIN